MEQLGEMEPEQREIKGLRGVGVSLQSRDASRTFPPHHQPEQRRGRQAQGAPRLLPLSPSPPQRTPEPSPWKATGCTESTKGS